MNKPFPDAIVIKILETYDNNMHRFDYRLPALNVLRNQRSINSALLHNRALFKDIMRLIIDKTFYESESHNRMRFILQKLYVENNTLAKIARELNISIERVRQLATNGITLIQQNELAINVLIDIVWPTSPYSNYVHDMVHLISDQLSQEHKTHNEYAILLYRYLHETLGANRIIMTLNVSTVDDMVKLLQEYQILEVN